MMKFLASLTTVFLFSLSFALPAYAADATFFGPIFPEECHCDTGDVPTAPAWGCVLQTIQNTINLAISLSVILAVLYIVFTGFMFVTTAGSPRAVEAAKTRLMNVVVGMLVLLSAWLIVDFIMKALYKPETEVNNAAIGPWNAILAGDNNDMCLEVQEKPGALPGIIGVRPRTGDTGVITAGEVTHQEGAAILSAGGVTLKSGASVQGTRKDTVDQVVAVKQACNCDIIVTSGTDGTHAQGTHSHANGYKIDLGLNAALTRYLQSLRAGGTRSGDGARLYYDRCGNEYAHEGDHWDISVEKGVCSPPKR